jgi:hypothetical protein
LVSFTKWFWPRAIDCDLIWLNCPASVCGLVCCDEDPTSVPVPCRAPSLFFDKNDNYGHRSSQPKNCSILQHFTRMLQLLEESQKKITAKKKFKKVLSYFSLNRSLSIENCFIPFSHPNF